MPIRFHRILYALLCLPACGGGASLPVEADAGVDGCPQGASGGDDACGRACDHYQACALCTTDEAGVCLSPVECAAQCRQDPAQTQAAACIAQLEACAPGEPAACRLGLAPPFDACARGCAALEECGLCATDVEGECVSLDQCVRGCRETEAQGTFECVAGIDDCSDEAGILACFETN